MTIFIDMSSRGFFIRIYCNLLVSEELVRFAALDPDLEHLRVEPAYSPGSGLNVKVRFVPESKIMAFCQDPKQREEIQKERQKLEDTLSRYIEFLDALASLDFKLSVSESLMFLDALASLGSMLESESVSH